MELEFVCIFATVMLDQMNQFIEENNILCDEQSGFRNQHSCESAINYVMADWKEAQNNGETVLRYLLTLKGLSRLLR